MNETESKKLVKRLYITEIALFVVSAVMNILTLNDIVQGKISKTIALIMIIAVMVISGVIRKHENSKLTRKMYMWTVLVMIIWFVTYTLILEFK